MKVAIEHWPNEGWYVGRVKEIPGVFSQGTSPEELMENIVDAYLLMLAEGDEPGPGDIGVPSPPSRLPFREASVELQLPKDTGDY